MDINKQIFENRKHNDGATLSSIYCSQKIGKGDELIDFARFKFCSKKNSDCSRKVLFWDGR